MVARQVGISTSGVSKILFKNFVQLVKGVPCPCPGIPIRLDDNVCKECKTIEGRRNQHIVNDEIRKEANLEPLGFCDACQQ
jgi:GMP synthase PP-ATPase subunit